MAQADKTAITVNEIGLALDEDEAGYLLDLLRMHVAGPLAQADGALGRIRVALEKTGVKRKFAHNATKAYAALYETEADADENGAYAALGASLFRSFT